MIHPTPSRRSFSRRSPAGLGAWLAIMVAVGIALFAASPLCAAELLMFEEAGCSWCARWRAEVGPGYPRSSEGKRAPLRAIDIHGPRPAGIVLAKPVVATPTFVLVDQGREVGRITGYPGADFFWGLLERLIAQLPDAYDPLPPSVIKTRAP